MRNINFALLLCVLVIIGVGCQKEISYQRDSITTDQATIINDTVYFDGAGFTGGEATVTDTTLWGSSYGDYLHLPYSDCKIAYVRLGVIHRKGAVVHDMQVNINNVDIKIKHNLEGKSVITFKYINPQPIPITSDNKHLFNCYTKFGGKDGGWIRIVPDSISILGHNDIPLPIKGFRRSDWPNAPQSWKSILYL